MSGDALIEARNLVGLARSACGDDPERWECAVRVLAALVAEIEAAPVAEVVEDWSGLLVYVDTIAVGKRVRLLAEDK